MLRNSPILLVYGIKPRIVLIDLCIREEVFATNAGLAREWTLIQWKNLLIESVFQPWGLFDTPKNRVVTSGVIWLLL